MDDHADLAGLDLMPIGEAMHILGVTGNALKKRAKTGSIRGVAPNTPNNGTRSWKFVWNDIARVANERNVPCPPAPRTVPADESPDVVAELRARNEDLEVGIELASTQARLAREDQLQARADMAEREAEELRREMQRLRQVIKQLTSTVNLLTGAEATTDI